MGDKIYFGHPINTYDTELEGQLLQRISEVFPACDIFQIDSGGMVTKINFLDARKALSIEETRKRIRTESGEIVPY